MIKKKKRNPNDTTMRNINALKKRVARLEMRSELTVHWLAQLDRLISGRRKKPK